jgi:DNA-binding transcriptional MerR regulator
MGGHDAATATDRDTATAITVATGVAAQLAGVSPRTIRRWIQQGCLVSIDGPNGQEVSPADLAEAAQRAKQGRGHDRGHGHQAADTDTATVTDTAIAARGQLDAVMQEWLAPLVDRIGKLERENGRLEQERDSQAETIDDLRRQLAEAQSAPPAAPPPPSATPTPSAAMDTPEAPAPAQGFWRRVRRACGGAG